MSTITTRTGYSYPPIRSDGRCQFQLPITTKERIVDCNTPCLSVAVDLHRLGRGMQQAAFCDAHGGEAAARDALKESWMLLAPPGVGDSLAVREAGSLTLTTREAYVVIRPEANRWLAWLGIGGFMLAVDNPKGGHTDKLGKPATRADRNGKRKQKGTKAFLTHDDALHAAIVAWKANLARRLTEITSARGGTLDWGCPVKPLPEPIVIELGARGNAWDSALVLPRRTRSSGMEWITGLRPSGEVA